MKNILTIACATFLVAAISCKAQDNVQLPKPSMNNQVTLMQALQNRHSTREYAEKEILDESKARMDVVNLGYVSDLLKSESCSPSLLKNISFTLIHMKFLEILCKFASL